MLLDSHIHVGQYHEYYFSPKDVHKLMEECGVDYYAVSSTTICEENYERAVHEIEELVSLDSRRVLPVMWITPEGLKGNIAWYLESDIHWKCIKIHPFLHKGVWESSDSRMIEVVDIARELKVPILIHTGEDPSCHSQLFEPVIRSEPDITFILAHGRPLQEALKLSKKFANAYVDSAFMPVADMKAFIDAGLENKLLWGTDMCIPKYFHPEIDIPTYYKEKLTAFRKICSEEQYRRVTYMNATKVFNVNNIIT